MKAKQQGAKGASHDMTTQRHSAPRLGWFSLPREIRDKVTIEVLAQEEVRVPVPGYVHLRNTIPKATSNFLKKGIPEALSKSRENVEEKLRLRQLPRNLLESYSKSFVGALDGNQEVVRRMSGIQLLATCKQVRSECLEVFYSHNVFVLPPGQVEVTRKHFMDTLPTEYTYRIRHIVIELGLQDLTPAVFDACRKALKEYMDKDTSQAMIRSLPNGRVPLAAPWLGALWGIFVKACLYRIWVQKYGLNHQFGPPGRFRCPTMKDPLLVTLRTKSRIVTVGSSEFAHCIHCQMPKEAQELLNHAKAAVGEAVEAKVNQVGWRGTWYFIHKGKWKNHVFE